MDWLTEPFGYAFMGRALLAGFLAVVATSVIGTWVVIRGMSFMGDALAHGVLPGISLAFVWGLDIRVGAIVSALAMVGGIGLVNRRARLPEDAGIGLLFVGMLALGVIVISRQRSYTGDLSSFLFGDIVGISSDDLLTLWAAAIGVVVTVVVSYRAFLALSFNPEKAWSLGMRPRLAHGVMLTLVAVSIVASFQAVGTLLVFGLLVAPPATASLLVRRVPLMMVCAVVIGWLAVVIGLVASYHLDTAASATVAFTAVVIFFVVLAAREVLGRVRSSSRLPGAARV